MLKRIGLAILIVLIVILMAIELILLAVNTVGMGKLRPAGPGS